MKYFLIALVLLQSLASAQWSRIPDISGNHVVNTLLVAHDTLYAATDSFLYIGVKNGTEWSAKNAPVPVPDGISCLLKFGGVIMAGTIHNGVFKSTDEGTSWQPFSNGLSGLGSMDIGTILIRRDSLIAGTFGAGVFATAADFSASWSVLGDSLPEYQGDNVFKMFVAGTTILAGAGANGYMFRYTDAQPWWNPIPINTPRLVGQVVSGMASDGHTVVAGATRGVYRSTDEGLSWDRTALVIPPTTIQIIPLFHGPTLFAVTTTPISSSVFASYDVGDTWESVDTVPLANVLDAAIVGDTLFLAGIDGLWEAPLSRLVTSSGEETMTPGTFKLQQNYPNPFNPSTTFTFNIPSSSFVRLQVFDALGREVSTLVSEQLSAGTYSQQWNAASLSSGVYFYRLTAGAYTETKKLLLLR